MIMIVIVRMAVIVIVIVAVVIMIVIVIVAVVAVVVAEDQVVVDARTLGVDDLDMVQQPIERLALAQLGDELAHSVVLLVGLAHLGGLLTHLHRDALVLTLDV